MTRARVSRTLGSSPPSAGPGSCGTFEMQGRGGSGGETGAGVWAEVPPPAGAHGASRAPPPAPGALSPQGQLQAVGRIPGPSGDSCSPGSHPQGDARWCTGTEPRPGCGQREGSGRPHRIRGRTGAPQPAQWWPCHCEGVQACHPQCQRHSLPVPEPAPRHTAPELLSVSCLSQRPPRRARGRCPWRAQGPAWPVGEEEEALPWTRLGGWPHAGVRLPPLPAVTQQSSVPPTRGGPLPGGADPCLVGRTPAWTPTQWGGPLTVGRSLLGQMVTERPGRGGVCMVTPVTRGCAALPVCAHSVDEDELLNSHESHKAMRHDGHRSDSLSGRPAASHRRP